MRAIMVVLARECARRTELNLWLPEVFRGALVAAAALVLPSVSPSNSAWALSACDLLGISEPRQLYQCIDELHGTVQSNRLLTNALEQEVDLLASTLCRMSTQMKNADVAAEAAIFCPSLPRAKPIPLPRARPPT